MRGIQEIVMHKIVKEKLASQEFELGAIIGLREALPILRK
jgi:hypothetical protein